MEKIVIDVWSDVVCPWCFIGKRRLEKALAGFAHRSEVTIRHRAFQLQPDAAEIMPTKDLLSAKYRISTDEVKEMQANVCAIADGEGLCYNLDDTLSGNTFDAHRLLLWAAEKGKQEVLLEAMYSSYFEQTKPLFSHSDLIAVATSIGLSEESVSEFLNSDGFAQEVIADRNLASQLGATGVPFFVFNMKFGISGAQPLESFIEVLDSAWADQI